MQKPLVLEHDQGMTESRRDLTWDAMYTFAERMNGSGRADGLEVRPIRRSSIPRFKVEEGLWIGDKWTDVFEPVRVRRMLSTNWRELQTVSEAAAKIGTFVDTRPDLA